MFYKENVIFNLMVIICLKWCYVLVKFLVKEYYLLKIEEGWFKFEGIMGL